MECTCVTSSLPSLPLGVPSSPHLQSLCDQDADFGHVGYMHSGLHVVDHIINIKHAGGAIAVPNNARPGLQNPLLRVDFMC